MGSPLCKTYTAVHAHTHSQMSEWMGITMQTLIISTRLQAIFTFYFLILLKIFYKE